MDAEKMMMQRRIDNLIEQLEIVKRERDALMYDLIDSSDCHTCMYSRCIHPEDISCSDCELDCPCIFCNNGKNQYKWRGLCKENGGVKE